MPEPSMIDQIVSMARKETGEPGFWPGTWVRLLELSGDDGSVAMIKLELARWRQHDGEEEHA